MKIVPLKILVGACFAIVRFFSGLLPYQIYRWLNILEKPEEAENPKNKGKREDIDIQKREVLVESAFLPFQSFSGGALFATCLLHMVPDVSLAVAELKTFGLLDSDYPFSQLIVSSGFFLVYFVEQISQHVLCLLGDGSEAQCSEEFNDEECKNEKESKNNTTQNVRVKSGSVIKRKHGLSYELDFSIESSPIPPLDIEKQYTKNLQRSKIAPFSAIREQERQNSTMVREEFRINSVGDSRGHSRGDSRGYSRGDSRGDFRGFSRGRPLTPFEEQLELNQLIETKGKSQQQILRYILIVLALSSYAILEGIAIGLQRSIANTWYLLGALSIHSASNLFSIGLDLVKTKTKTRTIIIHIFIISIASPLGVYIGLGASLAHSHITKGESAALVVLEGLSAGTILYITFFEVLNREKDLTVHKFKRAVCIIAGFGLLAYLEYAEVTK